MLSDISSGLVLPTDVSTEHLNAADRRKSTLSFFERVCGQSSWGSLKLPHLRYSPSHRLLRPSGSQGWVTFRRMGHTGFPSVPSDTGSSHRTLQPLSEAFFPDGQSPLSHDSLSVMANAYYENAKCYKQGISFHQKIPSCSMTKPALRGLSKGKAHKGQADRKRWGAGSVRQTDRQILSLWSLEAGLGSPGEELSQEGQPT